MAGSWNAPVRNAGKSWLPQNGLSGDLADSFHRFADNPTVAAIADQMNQKVAAGRQQLAQAVQAGRRAIGQAADYMSQAQLQGMQNQRLQQQAMVNAAKQGGRAVAKAVGQAGDAIGRGEIQAADSQRLQNQAIAGAVKQGGRAVGDAITQNALQQIQTGQLQGQAGLQAVRKVEAYHDALPPLAPPRPEDIATAQIRSLTPVGQAQNLGNVLFPRRVGNDLSVTDDMSNRFGRNAAGVYTDTLKTVGRGQYAVSHAIDNVAGAVGSPGAAPLVRGAYNLLPGLSMLQGTPLSMPLGQMASPEAAPLYRAGDFVARHLPSVDKTREGSLTADIADSAGTQAGILSSGVFGGAGPIVTSAGQGAESWAQDAKAHGASVDQQQTAAGLGALVGGLSQGVSADNILERLPVRFDSTLYRTPVKAVVNGAMSSAQQYLQDLTAQNLFDPNRRLEGWKRKGLISAGLGAVEGMLVPHAAAPAHSSDR